MEVTTKLGLRGRIIESLGTHGYMKCLFNEIPKGHDTVLMNLYKRIFPEVRSTTWQALFDYNFNENNKNLSKDLMDENDLESDMGDDL